MDDLQSHDEKQTEFLVESETSQGTLSGKQETQTEASEVGERQYSQAEYSALQSALEKRVQQAKTDLELTKTEAEAIKAELTVLRKEIDNPYADDDTRTAAQKFRDAEIAIAKAKADLAKEKAQLESEKVNQAQRLRTYLINKYSSEENIPASTLTKCKTLDEIELLVEAFREAKGQSKSTSPESSRGETRLPKPITNQGVSASRSFAQIEQAYIEGKISLGEYREARKAEGK